MIKQSLLLCIIFSFFTGFTLILSTACLAYASHQSKKDGVNFSKKFWVLAYFGNLVCQLAAYAFQFLSLIYGPISLAHPISLATQIFSNMVIFGVILKYEKIGKDTHVGTYINCVCIVLLIFVGARIPEEEQDIVAILGNTVPFVWAAVIIGAALIALPYLFLQGCSSSTLITENRSFWFLLTIEVMYSLIAASTFKMLVLVDGMALGFTVALAIVSNIVLLYASMLRAVVIPNQTLYVPVLCTTLLGMTAITGKIIWEDEIKSLGGYTCVFALFILANYLLSTFDLFSPPNAQFKYGNAAEIGISKLHRRGSVLATRWNDRRGTTLIQARQNHRSSILARRRCSAPEYISKKFIKDNDKLEIDRRCSLPEFSSSKNLTEDNNKLETGKDDSDSEKFDDHFDVNLETTSEHCESV